MNYYDQNYLLSNNETRQKISNYILYILYKINTLNSYFVFSYQLLVLTVNVYVLLPRISTSRYNDTKM